MDMARMALLDAGYSTLASGVTLDRFCGSGITSVNLAAATVAAGFTALLSLFNIAGRFVWASLSDRLGRRLTYSVFFVLGGALSLGAGPVPALGMVGVAWGHILATAAGVLYFLWYLVRSQGRLTLHLQGFALQRSLFVDILRVGAVACLSPVQSVLATLIFTGLLAQLGTEALAGYGIGQRLEFLLIPIAFGIGVAAVPMVGMAMGAGQVARARRVAWVAAGVSAFNLAVIGAVVTLAPDLWARLFTQDEAVLAYARQYLVTAGPAFPFFGLGLTLYFASQGAGQVIGPVLAGTVRLVLVAGVGWWLAQHQGTAENFYMLLAWAMLLYGLVTAAAVAVTPWGASVKRA
jgi:Na+-driven multidrug efflux pump